MVGEYGPLGGFGPWQSRHKNRVCTQQPPILHSCKPEIQKPRLDRCCQNCLRQISDSSCPEFGPSPQIHLSVSNTSPAGCRTLPTQRAGNTSLAVASHYSNLPVGACRCRGFHGPEGCQGGFTRQGIAWRVVIPKGTLPEKFHCPPAPAIAGSPRQSGRKTRKP